MSEGRQSDLAVMEAQEFKQKRRLERILDSREQVEQTADEAEELFIADEIAKDGRNILVLRAVKQYIRECWNLLLDHHRNLPADEQSVYLFERQLGSIEFSRSDRDPLVFEGLWELLHADPFYRETWTETIPWRHGQDVTKTQERGHSVPLEVSWQGYLTLNDFLNTEHDLEMQFEEMNSSVPQFGYESISIDDLDAPRAEEIKEVLDIDMRALKDEQQNGNGRTNGHGEYDE